VRGALSRPVGIALAIGALRGAIALQVVRDVAYPRTEAARTRVLYVRSPAAMKRLTFGFEALAADVYWIRAIQHYGGDRLQAARGAEARSTNCSTRCSTSPRLSIRTSTLPIGSGRSS